MTFQPMWIDGWLASACPCYKSGKICDAPFPGQMIRAPLVLLHVLTFTEESCGYGNNSKLTTLENSFRCIHEHAMERVCCVDKC